MANDIALAQKNAMAAAQQMLGGLQRTVQNAPTGGGDYLRFGKDGVWTFGTSQKMVDPQNDIALLNVLSVQAGYVCWTDYPKDQKKKNEKLGERMAPVHQPIDVSTLPDHGWEWRAQQGAEFKFIEGAHTGTQVKFVTSSQGGLERFAAMIAAVTERVASGDAYFFPLIAFDGDFYNHPSYGRTYKPLFEIVGWADVNGNEEPEGGAPAIEEKPTPTPEPEPVKEVEPVAEEKAPEPAEATEQEEPASDEPQPRRRRRR